MIKFLRNLLIVVFIIFVVILIHKPTLFTDIKNKVEEKEIVKNLTNKRFTAYVVKVIDGDTIEVKFKMRDFGKDVIRYVDIDDIIKRETYKLRLIGVDTPESVHPKKYKNTEFGKEVSNYTKKRLEGKDIEIEFDIKPADKYGRLLAYVWLDGKMYNEELLEKGYAKLMTIPPNVKYVEDFKNTYKKSLK